MQVSRRAFGSGALAVAASMVASKAARASDAKVRCGASTADGKKALQQYRRAVAMLKEQKVSTPASWQFLANTHGIPIEESTDEAIEQMFSTAGLSENEAAAVRRRRVLAMGGLLDGSQVAGVWQSCPHSFSQITYDFLPWHRAYLLLVESFIGNVLKEPFALPYWDYTQAPSLPIEFREAIDGGTQGNALFFSERLTNNHPDFAEGVIDVKSAFGQTAFGFDEPTHIGFSLDLEANLHGNVHAETGTSRGMGNPLFAARDPIFYLHHAAIDRLWESWRKTYGDPSSVEWREVVNRFAGSDDKIVSWKTASLLNLEELGYRYDTLEPVVQLTSDLTPFSLGGTTTVAESKDSPPAISASATTIEMTRLPAPFAAGSNSRYAIVLEAVSAASSPGTAYELYVNLPAAADESVKLSHRAGIFNVFAAGEHAGHGQAGNVIVDVTALVTAGIVPVDGADPISITIAPRHQAAAALNIKAIKLIAK